MLDHFEEELMEISPDKKIKYGLKPIIFTNEFLPKYFQLKELQFEMKQKKKMNGDMKKLLNLHEKFKLFEIDFCETNNDHENEFLAWVLSQCKKQMDRLLENKAFSQFLKKYYNELKSQKQTYLDQQFEKKLKKQKVEKSIRQSRFFVAKEIIHSDENDEQEFKFYQFPFTHQQIYTLKKTICGFFNGNGGRIYIGINNLNNVVTGIFLSYYQRELACQTVYDILQDIEPYESEQAFEFGDMINIHFLPLRDRKEKKMLTGKWVVKIGVKQGDAKKLFRIASNKEIFLRWEGKNYKLSQDESEQEINRRSQLQKASMEDYKKARDNFEDPLPSQEGVDVVLQSEEINEEEQKSQEQEHISQNGDKFSEGRKSIASNQEELQQQIQLLPSQQEQEDQNNILGKNNGDNVIRLSLQNSDDQQFFELKSEIINLSNEKQMTNVVNIFYDMEYQQVLWLCAGEQEADIVARWLVTLKEDWYQFEMQIEFGTCFHISQALQHQHDLEIQQQKKGNIFNQINKIVQIHIFTVFEQHFKETKEAAIQILKDHNMFILRTLENESKREILNLIIDYEVFNIFIEFATANSANEALSWLKPDNFGELQYKMIINVDFANSFELGECLKSKNHHYEKL